MSGPSSITKIHRNRKMKSGEDKKLPENKVRRRQETRNAMPFSHFSQENDEMHIATKCHRKNKKNPLYVLLVSNHVVKSHSNRLVNSVIVRSGVQCRSRSSMLSFEVTCRYVMLLTFFKKHSLKVLYRNLARFLFV